MQILRALFSSRRKTVKNNLAAWLTQSVLVKENETGDTAAARILAQAGIDPGARAETLTLKDFLALSDVVAKK
jgi:16S rRNA (adenine1518-N6/adenine1519-N6)-dimethyltransferase